VDEVVCHGAIVGVGQGSHNARMAQDGHCYTFAMVTTLPLFIRSADRGAWPWRRCPHTGRR